MGILLGTSDAYIQHTKSIFKKLYENYEDINHVSISAGGVLWVFVAHPFPANGHFVKWLNGAEGTIAGHKRSLALKGMKLFRERFPNIATSLPIKP